MWFALAAGMTGVVPAIPGLAAVIGLVAVVGATTGVAGVIAHTLVQTYSDPGYLGRVTAVLTLGTVGSAPLLFPLTGVAAAAIMAGNQTLRRAMA